MPPNISHSVLALHGELEDYAWVDHAQRPNEQCDQELRNEHDDNVAG